MLNIKDEDLDKINRIKEYASQVQGWFSDQNGVILYNLIRYKIPINTVVELGSWKGKSTIWLSSALKDKGAGVVYAIDHWKGSRNEEVHTEMLKAYKGNQLYNEFLNNINKFNLKDYVKPLIMDTSHAAHILNNNIKIGLLYIDASHEYEDVKRDFELFSPMVVKNGYIVFDDVPNWPGPTKVADELPKWYKIISQTDQRIVQKI